MSAFTDEELRAMGKTCSQCRMRKPLSAFNKQYRTSDGHRPACKSCTAIKRLSAPKRARAGARTGQKISDTYFWERVGKLPGTNACWEWQRGLSCGYGQVWDEGRVWRAHRWIYSRINGPIPAGLCVLHKCDNPKCVRPSHLFLGTQAENVYDCIHKGRGRQLSTEKLTPEQIALVRKAKREGGRTWGAKKFAAQFGVTRECISDAADGRTWKNIPEGV